MGSYFGRGPIAGCANSQRNLADGAKRNDSAACFEMATDVASQLMAKAVANRYPNFINSDMVNHGINGGVSEAVRRINTELWAKV